MQPATLSLLLATGNRGKIREFRALFAGVPGLTVLAPEDVGGIPTVIEDGDTFEHNARKVEIALEKRIAVLSDDSGLEVDALAGRPGVWSARYAGEHANDAANNQKLIGELAAVPEDQRSARYRVVLAFADPGVNPGVGAQPFVHVEHGRCEGRMRLRPAGDGGFGYDPYFEPEGYTCTMAELAAQEKNRISHRAQAALAMQRFLQRYVSERAGNASL